jgi:hypothetical protein
MKTLSAPPHEPVRLALERVIRIVLHESDDLPQQLTAIALHRGLTVPELVRWIEEDYRGKEWTPEALERWCLVHDRGQVVTPGHGRPATPDPNN